jgi:hypothetical protein
MIQPKVLKSAHKFTRYSHVNLALKKVSFLACRGKDLNWAFRRADKPQRHAASKSMH